MSRPQLNSLGSYFTTFDVTYFISGAVKKGDVFVEGAVVRLIQNEEYVDDTVTDTNGEFVFTGLISDSVCSVIAEFEDEDGKYVFQGYWGIIPKEDD